MRHGGKRWLQADRQAGRQIPRQAGPPSYFLQIALGYCVGWLPLHGLYMQRECNNLERDSPKLLNVVAWQ
jgi:hypothetical protein